MYEVINDHLKYGSFDCPAQNNHKLETTNIFYLVAFIYFCFFSPICNFLLEKNYRIETEIDIATII